MNFLIIFMMRKANVSGSLKKMGGGTGNVASDGMGPKVRWEGELYISEKSSVQQVVRDACHRG